MLQYQLIVSNDMQSAVSIQHGSTKLNNCLANVQKIPKQDSLLSAHPLLTCSIVWLQLGSWNFEGNGVSKPYDYTALHSNNITAQSTKLFHNSVQSTMKSSGGKQLRTFFISPQQHNESNTKPTKIKAIIVWCPELGTSFHHTYTLSNHFTSLGYVLCGIDYEGFGESSGKRNYLQNYELTVNDILSYTYSIKQKHNNTPFFIGGIGTGATLALCAVGKVEGLFQGMVSAGMS